MSDKVLDVIIDGVALRAFDLGRLRTTTMVQAFGKRVKAAINLEPWFDPDDSNAVWEVSDAIAALLDPRRDALLKAAEERKMMMPPRNLDLVVRRGASGPNATYPMSLTRVGQIILGAFDKAVQMTDYEFDAYATLGDEECDEQEIETLYDMFGTEFAERFYRRKNALIAFEEIVELQQKRAELERLIAQQMAIVEAGRDLS